MDRQVVEQKIESLRRCLSRVKQKTPATSAELEHDLDAQDVLTLNLTRAVQLSVDIGTHLIASSDQPAPDTMGQTFDVLARMALIGPELALRMKKAVGFRNMQSTTMKPSTGRSPTSSQPVTSRIFPPSLPR